MAEPLELVVGRRHGDHLTMRVLGQMRPDAGDYWDGNWLISPIIANLGSFTAHLNAGLRIDELQDFRHGLERIYRELRGEAVLTSLEHWISLSVVCRPTGALAIAGELDESSGARNTLRFVVEGLDQTDIPAMLSALAAIELAYPLLGQP